MEESILEAILGIGMLKGSITTKEQLTGLKEFVKKPEVQGCLESLFDTFKTRNEDDENDTKYWSLNPLLIIVFDEILQTLASETLGEDFKANYLTQANRLFTNEKVVTTLTAQNEDKLLYKKMIYHVEDWLVPSNTETITKKFSNLILSKMPVGETKAECRATPLNIRSFYSHVVLREKCIMNALNIENILENYKSPGIINNVKAKLRNENNLLISALNNEEIKEIILKDGRSNNEQRTILDVVNYFMSDYCRNDISKVSKVLKVVDKDEFREKIYSNEWDTRMNILKIIYSMDADESIVKDTITISENLTSEEFNLFASSLGNEKQSIKEMMDTFRQPKVYGMKELIASSPKELFSYLSERVVGKKYGKNPTEFLELLDQEQVHRLIQAGKNTTESFLDLVYQYNFNHKIVADISETALMLADLKLYGDAVQFIGSFRQKFPDPKSPEPEKIKYHIKQWHMYALNPRTQRPQ